MPVPRPSRRILREEAAAAAVVARWRRLTGGSRVRDRDRPTLVACSGGADSSALAISLAATPATIIVAHVLHDLRPPDEAESDRDAARELARRLACPFVEARVAVRDLPGNAEGNARTARYRELARLAGEGGCRFVATGHHADDQAETVLMRLLRGAGPQGLRGIANLRRLDGFEGRLVRPMLGVTRDDAEAICRRAAWTWRTDRTNLDTTRLRAALRTDVLPALRSIRPDVAQRLSSAADVQRGVARVLAAQAAEIPWQEAPDGVRVPRSELACRPKAVVGESLRRLLRRMGVGGDRCTRRVLRPVLAAIAGVSTDPRRFELAGVCVELDAHEVRITPRGGDEVCRSADSAAKMETA